MEKSTVTITVFSILYNHNFNSIVCKPFLLNMNSALESHLIVNRGQRLHYDVSK